MRRGWGESKSHTNNYRKSHMGITRSVSQCHFVPFPCWLRCRRSPSLSLCHTWCVVLLTQTYKALPQMVRQTRGGGFYNRTATQAMEHVYQWLGSVEPSQVYITFVCLLAAHTNFQIFHTHEMHTRTHTHTQSFPSLTISSWKSASYLYRNLFSKITVVEARIRRWYAPIPVHSSTSTEQHNDGERRGEPGHEDTSRHATCVQPPVHI